MGSVGCVCVCKAKETIEETMSLRGWITQNEFGEVRGGRGRAGNDVNIVPKIETLQTLKFKMKKYPVCLRF